MRGRDARRHQSAILEPPTLKDKPFDRWDLREVTQAVSASIASLAEHADAPECLRARVRTKYASEVDKVAAIIDAISTELAGREGILLDKMREAQTGYMGREEDSSDADLSDGSSL